MCYAIGPAPLPGADAWVLDVDAAPSVIALGLPTLLRLHAAGSDAFGDDLSRLQRTDIAGLLLPGVRDLADVCAVVERCLHPVLPVIDNLYALDQLRAIAQVPGVSRLVFDARALQRQLGISCDEGLLAFRSQLVLVSRLASLSAPVDDSTISPQRARALGFGACCCRSGDDINLTRAAFAASPSDHGSPA